MIDDLKTLWELQKVDTELSGLKFKIDSIPQQLQQISEAIKNSELEIEKKKTKEQEFSNQRKRLEQDIEEARDKVKKYKSQLLQVKTNKEYQAFLHEINTEEVKVATYEEQQIASFTESDDLKKQIEKSNKELEQEKRKMEVKRKELETELGKVKQEFSLKEEIHKNLAVKLPKSLLARYNQISKGRGGIGVVGIQDDICTGCKTLFPPQFVVELKKENKIWTCEQCGRILVWIEET